MIIQYPENWIVSNDLEKDVAEKIFYLSRGINDFEFRQDGLEIIINPEISVSDRLHGDILELMTKLAESYKLSAHEILEKNDGKVLFTEDPYPELTENSLVIMTSPGVPVYQGLALNLITGLDKYFREYALTLGADEHMYPTTLPTLSLIRSGYLKSFPQHALLVGTIHHDLESLKAITEDYDKYSETGEVDNLISNHTQILAPTVCGHCF